MNPQLPLDIFHVPAKSKSSPSRGAGVNAQYALHVWDSQEDSHNPSFPSELPFITAGLNRLRSHITFPSAPFFHEAPHDWPREYRVKGSILSQRTPDQSKLLAQMVGFWLDFLEVPSTNVLHSKFIPFHPEEPCLLDNKSNTKLEIKFGIIEFNRSKISARGYQESYRNSWNRPSLFPYPIIFKAPPQILKRALSPDPPDVGNRVSKPTPSTSRTNGNSITKVRSSLNVVDALRKGIALEMTFGAAQFSDTEQVQVVPMECEQVTDQRRE
ncbi:hypothetical protein EV44_g3815 [Erysiphe necator]|uniref:Uncharacterized protein n=1 Tax=Uncinula necator TaxID=52586 RepID=A0A0B1PCM9_UNCNE|nr:hypothetical protein EV44_g3815 [Erysiphe necator]